MFLTTIRQSGKFLSVFALFSLFYSYMKNVLANNYMFLVNPSQYYMLQSLQFRHRRAFLRSCTSIWTISLVSFLLFTVKKDYYFLLNKKRNDEWIYDKKTFLQYSKFNPLFSRDNLQFSSVAKTNKQILILIFCLCINDGNRFPFFRGIFRIKM